MHVFRIDLIWTKVQIAITALGSWLGYFLGDLDGLLIALIFFAALDYVTGVMWRHVRHCRSRAVLRCGLQGHLLQDADLHAGGHQPHSECPCRVHRLCTAYRRHLLLP